MVGGYGCVYVCAGESVREGERGREGEREKRGREGGERERGGESERVRAGVDRYSIKMVVVVVVGTKLHQKFLES